MSDERQSTPTAEEIAERVRARKQRQKWGGWVFVVGLLAGLAAAFWLRDLALTTLFLAFSAVGAGFGDPFGWMKK
jgi:hypothetical protein